VSKTLPIFPKPQNVSFTSGFFKRLKGWSLEILEPRFEEVSRDFFIAHAYPFSKTTSSANLLIKKRTLTHREGYYLEITPDQICIEAWQEAGVFRALNTLDKILQHPAFEQDIPCMRIEDFPVFKQRGFMLDVSRCKVPTMESIFELIDLIAKIGYNELQLYIEHTFAFAAHAIVWENSSPLTGAEIRKIDQYCKARFIELVPNLNSFGHFERWLRHEDYHHLAECPTGFRREEPFMERDHGSTLKPNQASLDFMDHLYEEYLPNFSSRNFNVGLDEPWELGQGWSADQVKSQGKAKVYLQHLDGIRRLVEKHGRCMQFWADVLLEEPENAKLVPPSAKPIIWGYEAGHPFAEQAKAISACGLSFCLAPGTATWRSFSGRWPTARQNLANAFTHAFKHKADGILLTSWGDCGNHQAWPIFYPSLFLAAQWGWNNQEIDDQSLAVEMNKSLRSSSMADPASLLMELGKLDQIIGANIPNASLAWNILFSPQPEKMPGFLKENFTKPKLLQGVEFLKSLQNDLDKTQEFQGDGKFHRELSLAIDLNLISLNKGISMIGFPSRTNHQSAEIVERFESNWILRARTGGLEESSKLLKHALSAT
jgi:hexosaminidase